MSRESPPIWWALCVSLALLGACRVDPEPDELRHIKAENGSTVAVVVDRQATLLFTTMLVPRPGTFDEQFASLLGRLDMILQEAGADRDDVVRLNLYAASDSAARAVRESVANAFSPDQPAVTLVVGELVEPDAEIALDAVAVASTAVSRISLGGASSDRADAAMLPPSGRVFLSGQAAEGEGLMDAVGATMESLHATLAFLGLSAEDVVQVRIFLAPMDSARAAEEIVAQYYRRKPAPPIVSAEWTNTFRPTEIELIAHRPPARAPSGSSGSESLTEAGESTDGILYITPAGMSSSPAFSRVVEVSDGDLVLTSGLSGTSENDAPGQVQEVFARLDHALSEAGSGYDSLVKATYYYSDRSARSALGEVRRTRYDPTRPPAASLVGVRGTGSGGAFTLEMIAVSSK